MASSMMIQDFARTQVRMMMARTSRLSQKRALDVMVAKAHSSEHAQALEAAFAELVAHDRAVRSMVEIRFIQPKPAGRMLAC